MVPLAIFFAHSNSFHSPYPLSNLIQSNNRQAKGYAYPAYGAGAGQIHFTSLNRSSRLVNMATITHLRTVLFPVVALRIGILSKTSALAS